VEQVLRHYVNDCQKNWDELLPIAEFVINNSVNRTTGFTPFFLDGGLMPSTPLALLAPLPDDTNLPATAQHFHSEWQSALESAQVAMRLAQETQAAFADRNRRSLTFAIGDQVYLATTNLDLASHPYKKLKPLFIGPFKVLQCISPVAYKLELPSTMQIHPVFHVSLLKPAYSDPDRPVTSPPVPTLVQGHDEWEVQEILDKRPGRTSPQYLVRWVGFGPEHDAWVPLRNLSSASEAIRAFEAELARPRPVPYNLRSRGPVTAALGALELQHEDVLS
jgi:hypothetical protein